jgi:EpsD family peptidyl-prolyl cis-trans isomerase
MMQNKWRRTAALSALGAALVVGVLTGCDEKKKPAAAGPAVAKVDQSEIPLAQLNHVLQLQRGLKPEQADAASRQILERLIDQTLAERKALAQELDRDPKVALQLELARREILARAYYDKVGETAVKPTDDEVVKYYETNPALFKDRRIYQLQELAIEARPEQVAQVKARLEGIRQVGELVEYLKASDIRFTANQAVRAAEQLPLASLGPLSALKDGQALFNATPTGAQIVVLAGSRAQPVTLEQAKPAIEQFLLNERKRELLAKDGKALRDAAKIEYLGRFAGVAASAPAAADAASSPALAASR